MPARLRHWLLVLTALPGLMFDLRRRRVFAEMRAFLRRLPAALNAPLPQALTDLTPANAGAPEAGQRTIGEDAVRNLADIAALLDRRSPLGLCLRRSLVRYHFLRRAGVPVVVNFGARFKDGRPDREVTGHAWLTLDGEPYFEAGENYRGFAVVLRYPLA